MKIGLSYSRCVRDIVDGIVDIEDVLVVISRTDFNPNDDDQWAGIWRGYTSGRGLSASEWAGYEDEDKFRSVSIQLYSDGKLHQPRQFGADPRRMPYYWLETILPSEELEHNPTVRRAFEQFQIVAGLSNTKLDKESH